MLVSDMGEQVMTMKAASLTSSLLVPKGRAIPSGNAPPAGGSVPYVAPQQLEQEQKTLREQVAALKSSFVSDEEPERKGSARRGRSAGAKRGRKSGRIRPPRPTEPAKETFTPRLDDLGRVKMSLRLDEKRHLMLKLAAAHLNNSAQELMVRALDDYLKKASGSILCPQFGALFEKPEGHDHDDGCCVKKT